MDVAMRFSILKDIATILAIGAVQAGLVAFVIYIIVNC
jgi:hypothetical protein